MYKVMKLGTDGKIKENPRMHIPIFGNGDGTRLKSSGGIKIAPA